MSCESVLNKWAALSTLPQINWAPVRPLISAAALYATERSEGLQSLISESEIMLAPLPDPLKADLGLQRWLFAAREESYSDCLAWVLNEVAESSLLLDLFGFNDPLLAFSLQACRHEIQREKAIKAGGRVFRLDIFVSFLRGEDDEEASLIIEVKKGSAESADTQKQQQYFAWHSEQRAYTRVRPGNFLIVTDAREAQYCGFEVLRWADICIRLRRMLPAINRTRGIANASMVLAFISAIERNLLCLELYPRGTDPFTRASVVEHLQQAVK